MLLVVIHESYIKQCLDLIEQEANRFVNRIRHRKRTIVQSIQKIAELEDNKTQKTGGEKSG